MMDYTKDEKVMKLLNEIRHEVEGWEYSQNSDWKNNHQVIEDRRVTLNKAVNNLKEYLNTKK
jgi:hypothetical protein